MAAIWVGTTMDGMVPLRSPTAMKFSYNDISSADAGRTNDASLTMHKNTVARKRTIALTWSGLDGAATRAVLRAFRPEYVYIRYFEPEDNAYAVKRFYCGNKTVELGTYHRSANSYDIGGVTYRTISFNAIEV